MSWKHHPALMNADTQTDLMEDERVKIRYLSKAPLFGELDEQHLESFAQYLHPESYAKGEKLFSRGEPSQAFYLIKSGWVQLMGEHGTSLATLGPGSLVGEADLLLQRPHSTGAVAVEQTDVWTITVEDVEGIIRESPEIGIRLTEALGTCLPALRDYLIEQRLRPQPAFGALPKDILDEVAAALEFTRFPADSLIFREGDCTRGLFVIERGRVQVFSANGEEGEFVELGAGDMLGEMSALTGKPYMISARALEETTAWLLCGESLDTLMKRYPSLRKSLSAVSRERLSAEDQETAAEKLRELPLFASLNDEALAEVASTLMLQHVPAGEAVYHQGDPGDALYLIEAGSVRVHPDAHDAASFRLGAGEFFGETALLTGKPRSVTIKAEEDTNLWVLYRTDFERLVNKYPSISLALSRLLSERLANADRTFVSKHLRHISLLNGLTSRQLEDVSDRLHPVTFRAGEVILQEGLPGDEMYLIESGQVEVIAGNGVPLATLREGEFFGEMALLTGRPRIATVKAVTDLDLWALGKADFDDLLLKYPALTITLSKVLSQRLSSANGRLISERLAGMAPAAPTTIPVSRTTPAPVRREPAAAPAARPSPGYGLQRSVVGALQGMRRSFDTAVDWFSAQSTAAQVRTSAIVLLVAWLGGVAAPATLISLLQSNMDYSTTSNAVLPSVETISPTATVSAPPQAEQMMLAGVPAIEARQAPAVLSADTPVPTDTPLPPTDTPVPPTPTDTPIPPTPTATFTPLAPAIEPAPAAAANVAAAAVAVAAEQPAAAAPQPAAPPVEWDGRLDAMGVHIAGADVPAGQPYWRVKSVKWSNEEESQGKHHIYVDVLDEAGNRVTDQSVVISWAGGQEILHTENKPAPEYACNFPMYAVLGTYNVRVDGLPSESVVGLGMGTPELPAWKIHTTFYVTFQRAVK